MAILLQIAENIFLLSFTGLGYYLAEKNRESLGDVKTNALIGLGLGLTAAFVTAVPVTLGDGATIDARAGPVILAAIVAGPVGGLMAATMGAMARGFIGGSFVFSGIAVYFVYASVGIVLRHFSIVTNTSLMRVRTVAVLVLASFVGAGCVFFLIQPTSRALLWLQHDLPYILVANALSVTYAAVILGIAMIFLGRSAELVKINETLNLAKRAGRFGIWDYDLRTGKLLWDDRSKELHGLDKSAIEGTFDDWSRNVHPEDLASTIALFEQALTGAKEFDTEYRVQLPDGGVRSIKGDAVIVRDRNGQPVRVVGSNIDLTQIREAEAKLAVARSVAAQAQRAETVGQLTGGVAHDFNNLLAVIVGNLELLKLDGKHSGEHREADKLIEASLSAARRGTELTQNMLAYARKAQLTPEPVDLNEVVRETEKWLSRTIESSVEIKSSLQPGLWQTMTDKASLQSALVNLLVNARDALGGSGLVTIETRNMEVTSQHPDHGDEQMLPGRYVVLVVADNGIGMTTETVDKIFDPFFTTKPVGEGTGLGLSMVQGFVRQSSGSVSVRSEPGKGTSFKLAFPATENTSPARARSNDNQSDVVTEQAGNGRILLVEDQKEVMKILKLTLVSAGFDVVTAVNGDEAFGVFRRDYPFDLVLTDIVMPGLLQGPSLAQEIRKEHPETRFIFLSGYASDSGATGQSMSAGDIRLMKPVSRAGLINAIETRLSTAQ